MVVTGTLELLARLLDPLQPAFLLATRWYVSWQFLKSGWLKVSIGRTRWASSATSTTCRCCRRTSPRSSSFGELFFPVLLVLAPAAALLPLGLFAVNLMAVISYAHVLLAEGFEAALAQHVLWGYMLVLSWRFSGRAHFPPTAKHCCWSQTEAAQRKSVRAAPAIAPWPVRWTNTAT
jgi:putative oxidoreductase